MLIAPSRRSGGIDSPTSAARMPMSDGRTRPMIVAITSTCTGVSAPVRMKIINVVAHAV
jgi:hypothetical protein